MGKSNKFYITDVFGEKRYSGNQLATFLKASCLSDTEMQQIAREINFSETTFILSDYQKNGGYDVRIFNPGEEFKFAGHPTLGTAFIIRKNIIKKPVKKVILNLKVGQVPVRFADDGTLWMKQVQPTFGDTLRPNRISSVLNINKDDIDSRWPIEEVSTGIPHIIVPLKTMDALKRVNIVNEKYNKLIEKTWAKFILTFSPNGYTENQHLDVRVFPIYLGISEDPATGSGNGCLAAYLVKNRYFESEEIKIITGQGYEIGSPSSLFLMASKNDDIFRIEVGGRVIPIAEGWWG
ncbi:MAG: PhzF family phenazine biosynthesis protein [Candidatus Hodarchaeota archaeon]